MELLLVKDDERVSRFVRRGLEAEGFSVTEAQDGIEGLRVGQAQTYDVIILDIMLPGLRGREVAGTCARPTCPSPSF